MKDIEELVQQVVGKGGSDLEMWQVLLRALIIYLVALAIIRLGKKRLLGRNSAFDVILGVVVGSMFSRTIHSQVPFLGSILATLVLVILHGIFAFVAVRLKGFGNVVKGHSSELVKDGQIDWDAMRKHDMTLEDLKESMRLKLNSEEVEKIQLAVLERNGSISFVTKKSEPRIVEIEVKAGVQRVRLEIS
jgi:uncharacterized membrane protein YcaP (DUF421 family)